MSYEVIWQKLVIITTAVGIVWGLIALVSGAGRTAAQQSDEELAKKPANPDEALISVPFEFNYNQGYGAENGKQLLLNFQPVILITLNEDWNVISRTILPVWFAGQTAYKFWNRCKFNSTWKEQV